MKNNLNLTIRAMAPEERTFCYSHDAEEMQKCGCIGHLRGDFDSTGKGFFTSWFDTAPFMKTDAFKAEFNDMVNALRFDANFGGILKNRASMSSYCFANPEGAIANGYTRQYGFRADTEQYSYMLRCNPVRGDYNFYIYAYDRAMLEQTLSPGRPGLEEQLDAAKSSASNPNQIQETHRPTDREPEL